MALSQVSIKSVHVGCVRVTGLAVQKLSLLSTVGFTVTFTESSPTPTSVPLFRTELLLDPVINCWFCISGVVRYLINRKVFDVQTPRESHLPKIFSEFSNQIRCVCLDQGV